MLLSTTSPRHRVTGFNPEHRIRRDALGDRRAALDARPAGYLATRNSLSLSIGSSRRSGHGGLALLMIGEGDTLAQDCDMYLRELLLEIEMTEKGSATVYREAQIVFGEMEEPEEGNASAVKAIVGEQKQSAGFLGKIASALNPFEAAE